MIGMLLGWVVLAALISLGVARAIRLRDRRERPVATSRCSAGCPCATGTRTAALKAEAVR